MKKSIWEIKLPEFNRLEGDIKTDVLIIGGGLCGILCAYYLDRAGIDYILVEGRKIASGTTTNTTAKITSQHGLIYHKIIRDYGKEKAKMYLDANERAVKEYERLCKNIDCDFEIKDAYTYSLRDEKKLTEELKALESLGFNAAFIKNPILPFDTKGAIRFKNQAQFNPLKFISEISKNLNIYEETFIDEITPHKAITKNGKITAEKIIVATHFPFINKHGEYFLKLYQHRSYVTAYENAKLPHGMYIDEDKKGISLRSYKNFLIAGGQAHRTGKKSSAWDGISDFMKKYYPDAKELTKWAAQDCMSLDGIPYIGKYSKNTPNLYVATGFNKWGITSSLVSAMILSDMIKNKHNDYAEVFSPKRSILKPQLFVNGFEAAFNLLTPTAKRCPHMGCALKWNKYEHTWDCPCHGSRFEENGKLIDNPATGDTNL